MYFSPFDALGLCYGYYQKHEIARAFRKASLKHHPDKRGKTDVPLTQWPTLEQCSESKAFLLAGDDFEKYYGYPETNVPDQEPVTKELFSVCQSCRGIDTRCQCESSSIQFRRCRFCSMILPESLYLQHLEEVHPTCSVCGQTDTPGHAEAAHPEKICQLCGNFASKMLVHIRKEHILSSCKRCEQCASPSDLIRHIKEGHIKCPLCNQAFPGRQELHRHLGTSHLLEVNSEEITIDQIRTTYKWLECPCDGCQIDILEGKLLYHVQQRHPFDWCIACPRTDRDLANAFEHLKTHLRKLCHICGQENSALNHEYHLVTKHGWEKCKYCIYAAPGPNDLADHIAEHKLEECSKCSALIPRSEIRAHYAVVHSFQPCPFCDELYEEEKMLTHIMGFHTKAETCQICGWKGALKKYITHLSEHIQQGDGQNASVSTQVPNRGTTGSPASHLPLAESTPRMKCDNCRKRKRACTAQDGNECEECRARGQECPGRVPLRKRGPLSLKKQRQLKDMMEEEGTNKTA